MKRPEPRKSQKPRPSTAEGHVPGADHELDEGVPERAGPASGREERSSSLRGARTADRRLFGLTTCRSERRAVCALPAPRSLRHRRTPASSGRSRGARSACGRASRAPRARAPHTASRSMCCSAPARTSTANLLSSSCAVSGQCPSGVGDAVQLCVSGRESSTQHARADSEWSRGRARTGARGSRWSPSTRRRRPPTCGRCRRRRLPASRRPEKLVRGCAITRISMWGRRPQNS